eukprot:gene7718-887_t
MSLIETRDSLKAILGDEEAFQQVLDIGELHKFIMGVCGDMGVQDSPNRDQVNHVFQHLDLNSDDEVSKDELSVFLRHLFNEQLKHTEEKLKKEEQKAAGGK